MPLGSNTRSNLDTRLTEERPTFMDWNARMYSLRCAWLVATLLVSTALGRAARQGVAPSEHPNPIRAFTLSEEWQSRFWSTPEAAALLDLEPKALAELVPVQAGFRLCRCPACGASERDDPLEWSPLNPSVLKCKSCGIQLPNEQYPAKVPLVPGLPPAVPEEVVEVLPRVFHRYPYHAVPPEQQLQPDERIYLSAKRDYEARVFLSKAALYAALKYRAQARDQRDERLARLASVILLRFAQVYPAYAMHDEAPGKPKMLHTANLRPPFRAGYRTAKWDWLGCHEVPIELLAAYSALRDGPQFQESARGLGISNPQALIEDDWFRAAGRLLAQQPEEASEAGFYACRGLLAVGGLLQDRLLVEHGLRRLDHLLAHGFYHDGSWLDVDPEASRRVQVLLTEWIEPLVNWSARFTSDESAVQASRPDVRLERLQARLERLRKLRGRPEAAPRDDVVTAAFAANPGGRTDYAALAGGGETALIRVGGEKRALLADLRPTRDPLSLASTFQLSLARHGQSPVQFQFASPRNPTTRGVRFFAVESNLQVASFVEAEPNQRRRVILAAVPDADAPFIVCVVVCEGAGPHLNSLATGPRCKLEIPEGGTAFSTTRASTWSLEDPTSLDMGEAGGDGIRVHLLGEFPLAVTASEPRSAHRILLRHEPPPRNERNHCIDLYVFEPIDAGRQGGLSRVGRVASAPHSAVLAIERNGEQEYLLVNLSMGRLVEARLPDGVSLATDGLVVHLRPTALTLAGGTFARAGTDWIEHPAPHGSLRAASMRGDGQPRAYFESNDPYTGLAGYENKTMVVEHGDGVRRAWTIASVEPATDNGTRIWVREDVGFVLSEPDGPAIDEVVPRAKHPAPHTFGICLISTARIESTRPAKGTSP